MAGAERAASVKLSLDSGEYLVQLRKVGDENARVADAGKRKFDAMGKGIDGAKGAMRSLWSTAKDGIRTLTTLGGAFTAASAAKQAVDLQAKFRMIANQASNASGAMVTASQVQMDVARSAAIASRTSGEMVTVFGDLRDATGDLEFTREVLGTIGTTATGTGRSLASLTVLADQLHTKFGIAASEMGEAFARVEDHASRGGPTFDEFSQAAGTLGDDLLQAGMRGQQGLDFLLGALIKTDDEMQDFGSQVGGIKKLLLNLGKGSELKSIAKDLAIDPAKLVNEKDAIARMMKILSFGEKGLKTLKANFVGPEEQKALRILFTDPFEDALKRAAAGGIKGKDAIDFALKVLEGQIEEFGESNLNAAEIQKRAAKEMESPQANLRKALERLEQSFGQPEIITAIDELSKALPELARIFAGFVTFAAKNPLLAGALGLGGHVGSSFLSGAAAEVLKAHLAGGKQGGAELKGGVEAGAKAGSSILGTAAKAFGIAAAAAVAFEAGRQAIDNHFQGETDASTRVMRATLGGKPKTAADRDRQVAELEAAIHGSRDVGKGFFNRAMQGAASGLGAAANMKGMPGLPGMLGATAHAIVGPGGAGPSAVDQAEKQREEARKRIAELRDIRFGTTTVDQQTGGGAARPVKLEAGAPRLIGTALVDALRGVTLDVRMASGSGAPASARSPGGRGPLGMPAVSPGGGT